MKPYQREFLDFVVETGALRFGQFRLKSGRNSPYFFNAGEFNSGARLARLGEFYARTLDDHGLAPDMIFGPAYKGIPLVSATAIASWQLFAIDLPFAFNRKEVKDHGEGGIIIGAPLQGRVLIIDDVVSAGISVDESVSIIRARDAEPAGVVIALDRCERASTGTAGAVASIRARHGIDVFAVVDLRTLIAYLETHENLRGHLDAVQEYYQRYGE